MSVLLLGNLSCIKNIIYSILYKEYFWWRFDVSPKKLDKFLSWGNSEVFWGMKFIYLHVPA